MGNDLLFGLKRVDKFNFVMYSAPTYQKKVFSAFLHSNGIRKWVWIILFLFFDDDNISTY